MPDWNSYYSKGQDFRLATGNEIDQYLKAFSTFPKNALDIGCGTVECWLAD